MIPAHPPTRVATEPATRSARPSQHSVPAASVPGAPEPVRPPGSGWAAAARTDERTAQHARWQRRSSALPLRPRTPAVAAPPLHGGESRATPEGRGRCRRPGAADPRSKPSPPAQARWRGRSNNRRRREPGSPRSQWQPPAGALHLAPVNPPARQANLPPNMRRSTGGREREGGLPCRDGTGGQPRFARASAMIEALAAAAPACTTGPPSAARSASGLCSAPPAAMVSACGC